MHFVKSCYLILQTDTPILFIFIDIVYIEEIMMNCKYTLKSLNTKTFKLDYVVLVTTKQFNY